VPENNVGLYSPRLANKLGLAGAAASFLGAAFCSSSCGSPLVVRTEE